MLYQSLFFFLLVEFPSIGLFSQGLLCLSSVLVSNFARCALVNWASLVWHKACHDLDQRLIAFTRVAPKLCLPSQPCQTKLGKSRGKKKKKKKLSTKSKDWHKTLAKHVNCWHLIMYYRQYVVIMTFIMSRIHKEFMQAYYIYVM